MEDQFKKLLQGMRSTNKDLNKTFEGDLFKGSSWFFDSEIAPLEFSSVDDSLQIQASPKAPAKESQRGLPPLCEVLFVGDSYAGDGEDLLGRMIGAMKLKAGEFHRFHLNHELEHVVDLAANLIKPDHATQELFNAIVEKRPKIVVALGATVTNVLLGRREKLSAIHGQFFEKNIDECYFTMMPLFHPDFLIINPNMKRTAWIDLQKVMERVGKI